MISWILKLFRKPKQKIPETSDDFLEIALEIGEKIEAYQRSMGLCLAQMDFEKDFGTREIQVTQMIDWNTKSNFAHSSLYDELKIISQGRPKLGKA